MRTTGFLLTYNARKGTPMLDGLEGEEINKEPFFTMYGQPHNDRQDLQAQCTPHYTTLSPREMTGR